MGLISFYEGFALGSLTHVRIDVNLSSFSWGELSKNLVSREATVPMEWGMARE